MHNKTNNRHFLKKIVYKMLLRSLPKQTLKLFIYISHDFFLFRYTKILMQIREKIFRIQNLLIFFLPPHWVLDINTVCKDKVVDWAGIIDEYPIESYFFLDKCEHRILYYVNR